MKYHYIVTKMAKVLTTKESGGGTNLHGLGNSMAVPFTICHINVK